MSSALYSGACLWRTGDAFYGEKEGQSNVIWFSKGLVYMPQLTRDIAR